MTQPAALHMWIAGAILAGAYALIFSERMHRTLAGVLGAVVMVGVGTWLGFYSQEAAVAAIDANTMLLLLGMMIVVVLLRPTGGFEWLAIRIAKHAHNSPRRLVIYLGVAVSVLSMFLDNVTTVIIFAPITVLITRMLNLNPAPYLIAEAMLSNVGGVATLVGDPPNIMIGSAAGFDFNTFLVTMGPMILPAWLATVVALLIVFNPHFRRLDAGTSAVMDLNEAKAIRDPQTLTRLLITLGGVIALFFVHHHFRLYPAYVAFLGVALAFVLVRPDPEVLLKQVEWSVLLFFAALFVIVGGVEGSGLLALIGQELATIAREPGMLLGTALALMWVAAILSAVVDNIPFTVTMIPIVGGLESQGLEVAPLWWALAIGVGLGGNGTHVGATANIICVSELERSGIAEAQVSPGGWLRAGIPTTFVSLIAATLAFIVAFAWL
jgi:Na+/H+ antiporter NhaD/arsenite permease-like protein